MRLLLLLSLLVAWPARADPLPPAPQRWMTDTVGFVSPATREAIDRRLEAYQAATGHQVVVWIGGTIGGADLADWAARTFAAWKVGRAGVDDGVVMFVLAEDRTIDIEVGYGLEGQLTDAKAARIIDDMRAPLRAGEPDRALREGVEAILTAIEGRPFPGDAIAPPVQPAREPPRGQTLFMILAGVAFLILFATNPRLAVALLWSLSSGRGGSGSLGGSRGGFSGGGGRSGGGGARGSW